MAAEWAGVVAEGLAVSAEDRLAVEGQREDGKGMHGSMRRENAWKNY